MAAVTICSDFGAPKNKVLLFPLFPHLFAMKWQDQMPWSSCFECWVLSQLFHSPLSPSSRGSLIPLRFLPWGWCHLHNWSYWCFFQQSGLLVFQKQIPMSFKNLNRRFDFPMCHSKQALILEYIISSCTIKIFLYPLLQHK